MTSESAAHHLKQRLGEAVIGIVEFRGEHSVSVELGRLREALELAKGELGFDMMLDISSVDHAGEAVRFEMVYELYSLEQGVHLRIKARVGEVEPKVPTVSDLWPTADWHEREVWDMMGIWFDGHPDLRRILMWEGYPYHPLRKEFPLAGKPSEMPDVAFTDAAPLAGGPFVTSSGALDTVAREPRAKGE
jgi:NADH-quinone oxidoreductase subunit C